MKIGILTLPLETNYGGVLQIFALQYVLRKMGHEVVTIDRHHRKRYPSFKAHIGGYLKRVYYKYAKHKHVSTSWNPYITDEENLILSSKINSFVCRNINLTERVFSDELSVIDNKYKFDAYIVGSDQVWQEYYCPNSFLDFVSRTNIKKVFYAASCGRKPFFFSEEKVITCKELVKKFSGVSVREDFLVSQCREVLNVEATLVLDPTMLLNCNEYLKIVSPPTDTAPIVFSYILDSNDYKMNIVSIVAKQLKKQIVNGNVSKKYVKGDDLNDSGYIYPSIDDWINNIHRASFVITDSFHGTVFSILFNKPFISIGNASRGLGRFESLLNMFSLRERLITDADLNYVKSIVYKDIDYNRINTIIERERKKSLNFLVDCLA